MLGSVTLSKHSKQLTDYSLGNIKGLREGGEVFKPMIKLTGWLTEKPLALNSSYREFNSYCI